MCPALTVRVSSTWSPDKGWSASATKEAHPFRTPDGLQPSRPGHHAAGPLPGKAPPTSLLLPRLETGGRVVQKFELISIPRTAPSSRPATVGVYIKDNVYLGYTLSRDGPNPSCRAIEEEIQDIRQQRDHQQGLPTGKKSTLGGGQNGKNKATPGKSTARPKGWW